MTADRPTGPATAAGPFCPRCGHEDHDGRNDPRCGEIVGTSFTGSLQETVYEPDYCGCVDVDRLYSRLIGERAAERARILAALPEALAKAFEDYDLIDFGTDPHGFPVDDSTAAAALAAAIEKEIGEHD